MTNVTVDASEIVAAATRYRQAQAQIPDAISRAINYTGNRARTPVIRDLANQTGLGYGAVRANVVTTPSRPQRLDYSVRASGKAIPLKEFGAVQRRSGVSARPWGNRRVFPHTFIVEGLGGQVYKRIGPQRLPIKKLYGPAIPKELVRGKPPETWQQQTRATLPERVRYELDRMLSVTIKHSAPTGPIAPR